jgi:site-specific DNA recombinase
MVDLPRLYKLAKFHRVAVPKLDKCPVADLNVGIAGLLDPLHVAQIAQQTYGSLEEQVVKEGKSAGGLSYGYRIPIGDRSLRMTGELLIDDD